MSGRNYFTSSTPSLTSPEDHSEDEGQVFSVDTSRSAFERLHASSADISVPSTSVQAIYVNILAKSCQGGHLFRIS